MENRVNEAFHIVGAVFIQMFNAVQFRYLNQSYIHNYVLSILYSTLVS